MSERIRHVRGPVALALALALAATAIAGVSAYRKIQTFQPLGLEARLEAGSWRVSSVGVEATGLAEGDRILLVNGQQATSLERLGEALRARPTSELVVLRDDRVETVAYKLPAIVVDVPYLVLSAIGAVYLLIGFYTLLRDRRRSALLFYLWCLASATVYMVAAEPPFDFFGKAGYLADELARIFVAPLTLHLFAIFPRPLAAGARLRRLLPFAYLPAAFLLALQVDLMVLNGKLLLRGATGAGLATLDRLELFHVVIFTLLAAGVLAWRLRFNRHEPQRQATWIAVGMAAGYVPFLSLYVLPHSLGFSIPWALTTAAVLPLGLVPLTFAYAILRYKLWDIGVIVRDTISLSLTILIGVFAFALANLTVTRLVSEELALARNLVTFLSGLTIAGMLLPTRRGISASLERLQYRGSFGRRRALADFGRELLRERDLGRLTDALAHELADSLDISRTNLLLVHGGSLLPVQPENELPQMLPFTAFGSDFWDADVESLSGVELPGEEPSALARLYRAGYRYAFPLRVRDKAVGVALTGYRADEVPLSTDDQDLIRNLLNQAALALENAQLLNQVQLQLHEVSRLQRFSQGIIESSPAGIAVLEPDGRIRSANQAFARMAGREESRVAGRRLRDLLPIEPVPAPDEGIRETRFRDAEDRERYLQISTAPLRQEDPDRLRVLVVQDITERVEMENALKEKERLAALGMLAAGVAHEVNTPITGISSYAQMLLSETPESDPRHQVLRKVEKQTFRAAQIVRNLLEFARNREPGQGPVALGRALTETLDLLAEQMAECGVELVYSPPADEIVIQGNEGELQQVFTNLASNAFEAMADGGRLAVEVETGSDWVWVSFEDTGPGIAPRDLDKIFQPFFSSKLSSGGVGLGLAITYNIVRRHGGDIRVISHPGEGSRFVVELPRTRSNAPRRA